MCQQLNLLHHRTLYAYDAFSLSVCAVLALRPRCSVVHNKIGLALICLKQLHLVIDSNC